MQITAKRAAELCGVKPQVFSTYRKRHHFPAPVGENPLLFDLQEVNDWLEKRNAPPALEPNAMPANAAQLFILCTTPQNHRIRWHSASAAHIPKTTRIELRPDWHSEP